MPARHRHGFTLIELSIVLVIVGLLAGGILVGRDLIQAAQIRSTVSQYDRFNAAINIFIDKYNYLPGDIPPDVASEWGLFAGLNGTAQRGDGDGWISTKGGLCTGETLVFWRHLSEVNLIEGSFGNDAAHPITATGNITTSPPSEVLAPSGFLPKSSLGRDIYWSVYTDGINPPFPLPPTPLMFPTIGSSNFYMMYAVSYFWSGGCVAAQKSLTPIEAYAIDLKLDDGIPRRGRVMGAGEVSPVWNATPISGVCTAGGANVLDPASTYNTRYGDVPACRLYLYSN